MATARFWQNVEVAVQSALGSAKTITDITKADPAVVTSAAHGLSSGDFVVFDVLGMNKLDERIARVANSATDTFEAEGVDSSEYNDFSSGNAKEITFGTTINTLVDVSASGGEPEFADLTTIHDSVRRQTPVIVSPVVFTFDSIWDPADAGLQALKAASESIGQRAVKFKFSDGALALFYGYISAPGFPTGGAQDLVKTPITITANGAVTFYAS